MISRQHLQHWQTRILRLGFGPGWLYWKFSGNPFIFSSDVLTHTNTHNRQRPGLVVRENSPERDHVWVLPRHLRTKHWPTKIKNEKKNNKNIWHGTVWKLPGREKLVEKTSSTCMTSCLNFTVSGELDWYLVWLTYQSLIFSLLGFLFWQWGGISVLKRLKKSMEGRERGTHS